MLELTLRGTCRHCGVNIEKKVCINGLEPGVISLRTGQIPKDFTRYSEPYPIWHTNDLEKGHVGMNVSCVSCNATYYLRAGVLSLYCSLEDWTGDMPEDAWKKERASCARNKTFLAWLKNQVDRKDWVGDLAQDAFHAEGVRGKREAYRENPGWPKRTSVHQEWRKFLEEKHVRQEVLDAFEMAWAEYHELVDY